MNYSKNRVGNLAISSLLFAGVVYISIWITPSISKGFSTFQSYQCPSSNMTAVINRRDELERALDGASMENKTLIIAIVNKAYVEGEKAMVDLFLDSFWLGLGTRSLVDHLLLVALDQIAFDRCNFLRLHCYRLVTDGVDFGTEKLYMSDDFIKMMWRRTLFLADVLKRGYSFIFTDTDVMWLRNPFLRLSRDEDVDIQISCDKFNGKSWSHTNHINTGFYFIRSNNRTISLFNMWYSMKDNSNYTEMKDQDVLQRMLHTGQLGVKLRFLNPRSFSGFCQHSIDFRKLITVHANCCRTIQAKVTDLTAVLTDWKKFRVSMDDQEKFRGSTNDTPKHVACINSWRGFNESLR